MAVAQFSSVFRLTPPAPPPPRFRCHVLRSQQLSLPDETLTNIQKSGVIACLRAQSSELALEAAKAAITAGISVLEVVVSTPGVFQVIHQLVEDYPMATIGAGTVLNAEDAKLAIDAGAKFLMSPAIVKDILDECSESLYIPGAMTPTEILSAFSAGAKIVKVYPVSALGGTRYIATLKRPFSHIPMVASQGVAIESIGEYIAQGASSVVLSDAIFDKEAMAQRDFSTVYQLAYLAALGGKEAVERFDAGRDLKLTSFIRAM